MPKTIGREGVCHLLADAVGQRPQPMSRVEAVRWAVAIGHMVADRTDVTLDPSVDLARFISSHGITTHLVERTKLPGVACDTCVATQSIPDDIVATVVSLAQKLDCDAGEAFQWASRLAAIVLANPDMDHARGPDDVLAALIMHEYARQLRKLSCERTGL